MSKIIRILSIDGGGIRGVLAGSILVALESKLQQISGNQDARLVDYFDLVAGTSTGGILACLYMTPNIESGRPRYSTRDAVDFYLKHGPEIFHIPVGHRLRTVGGLRDEKYPAATLERVLNEYFGDLRMQDLLRPSLLTSYDIQRRRAFFLTQHDAIRTDAKDFLVADATRATSAAPTYFEAVEIASATGVRYPLIDGGVFANNPSLCAYAEARTHFGAKAAEMAILSIGTGSVATPYHHEEAKDWGVVEWMAPLIDIIRTGVSETVHYECKLAFEAVGFPDHYLRLDVDMAQLRPGASTKMDDVTPANLRSLEELGVEAAERADKRLTAFAEMLIAQGVASR